MEYQTGLLPRVWLGSGPDSYREGWLYKESCLLLFTFSLEFDPDSYRGGISPWSWIHFLASLGNGPDSYREGWLYKESHLPRQGEVLSFSFVPELKQVWFFCK